MDINIDEDPIFLAAMKIRGYGTWKDLPWDDQDKVSLTATRELPGLYCIRNLYYRLTWNNPEHPVRYEISETDGAILTSAETSLPETVLNRLSGNPLSTVIDVPGADQMIIEAAVNSKAFVSDPLDLRIAVIKR